jgi:hypothetical protein
MRLRLTFVFRLNHKQKLKMTMKLLVDIKSYSIGQIFLIPAKFSLYLSIMWINNVTIVAFVWGRYVVYIDQTEVYRLRTITTYQPHTKAIIVSFLFTEHKELKTLHISIWYFRSVGYHNSNLENELLSVYVGKRFLWLYGWQHTVISLPKFSKAVGVLQEDSNIS